MPGINLLILFYFHSTDYTVKRVSEVHKLRISLLDSLIVSKCNRLPFFQTECETVSSWKVTPGEKGHWKAKVKSRDTRS